MSVIRALKLAGLGLVSSLILSAIFRLPNAQREFATITLASCCTVAILPGWFYNHARKIEPFHHEISHGIMALLSGGSFHRFYVYRNAKRIATECAGDSEQFVPAGHAACSGNPRIVAPAGCIGTLIFGCVYLAKSAQSDIAVLTLYALAILYALSILKAGSLHTAFVGIGLAAAIGMAAILFPNSLGARFLINLFGVILVLEGLKSLWVLHIQSITQRGSDSDAEVMSRVCGMPAFLWALVYSVISISLLAVMVLGAWYVLER